MYPDLSQIPQRFILLEVLRKHAILSLDRPYRRFLEAAVVTNKLLFLLGLKSKIHVDDLPGGKSPFDNDETFEVKRRPLGSVQKFSHIFCGYSLAGH